MYRAAKNEYNNYQVDWTEVNAALEELNNNQFYRLINTRYLYVENEDGTSTSYYVYPISGYLPYNYNGYYGSRYYNAGTSVKLEQGEYIASYGMDSLALELNVPTADIRQVELDVKNRLDAMNNWLKSDTKQLEEAQAQYNGKAVYPTGEYDPETGEEIMKAGLNAVDSCAVLKKAWETLKADEDATDPEIADAKTAYENWLNQVVVTLENQIKYYTQWVEDDKNYIACLEIAWDYYQNFDTYAAELQAKVDAINALIVKADEEDLALWKTYALAYWTYLDAYAEYRALNDIYYGYNDGQGAQALKTQIETWEGEIVNWEAEKEDLAKLITYGFDYNSNWTEATYDEFIEWKKQQIAMKNL